MKVSKKILIVEDESTLNEAYQIALASAGHDIFSAFDGQQALDIAQEIKPDVILLDLRMPIMDGIEFLRQFKPADHPETTVIVFSNYDMQTEIDEAYQLGADKYILKAWASPKELLKIVQEAAQNSKDISVK